MFYMHSTCMAVSNLYGHYIELHVCQELFEYLEDMFLYVNFSGCGYFREIDW